MISLNDRSYPYQPGMSLLELLRTDNVDIHGPVLITLNGALVKKAAYADIILNDGDAILAIKVVSGG